MAYANFRAETPEDRRIQLAVARRTFPEFNVIETPKDYAYDAWLCTPGTKTAKSAVEVKNRKETEAEARAFPNSNRGFLGAIIDNGKFDAIETLTRRQGLPVWHILWAWKCLACNQRYVEACKRAGQPSLQLPEPCPACPVWHYTYAPGDEKTIPVDPFTRTLRRPDGTTTPQDSAPCRWVPYWRTINTLTGQPVGREEQPVGNVWD
jgi:hypothetical protein